MLWVLIYTLHLTVCSNRVMYDFQSESTLYSCLNVKELLVWNRCKIWSLCSCNGTRTHNHLVRQWHSTIQPNWRKDWDVLWVLICTVHLTVCSNHATYAFQSKSTLYSCLNVKELVGRNRCEVWSLSDCNGTRTHNHLRKSCRVFERPCSYLNFRFHVCFKQGVPWYSGN